MKLNTPRKLTLIRWLVFGAWLIGVTVHLLVYVLPAQPTQTTEWYASLGGYRALVFGITRFPLWVAGLGMLVLMDCWIRRER
ncbi:hypothetical protein LMG18101_04660 [Ralstonia flaminis]|jgi:hypothetical protein|uniref:Transmembrane protein n=1 Tax=Ralstonia flaminis TaxID=3058597 RepID=A0ABN9JQY2_9RALS|nr:hypothetical protein LMG18101_04660 [Ralstonia sp. LMG 18101]